MKKAMPASPARPLTALLIAVFCAAPWAERTFALDETPRDERYALNFVGPNNPFIAVSQARLLADMIVDAGVKWAFLPVLWAWSEPQPPTMENEEGDRWQGPSGKWHRYELENMDIVVKRLGAQGINIVIGMYKHPTWAGGQQCIHFGNKEEPANLCGIIYNSHKAIFSEALGDLAFHLAWRYPQAAAFSLWNEPNGHNFFSPEPPLHPDLVGEYMNLIVWPARQAIKAERPDALIIGPELAAPREADRGPPAKDANWGYKSGWLENWAMPLLKYFPDEFDVYTFHNYSNNWRNPGIQVSRLLKVMFDTGAAKPIWMTEVAMRGCKFEENEAADFLCELYKENDARWEKTFYFNFHADEPQSCNSLVQAANWDSGWTPTWLHGAFKAIVTGDYHCNGH